MNSPLSLAALPAALSSPEQARLMECETHIERGFAIFLDVGNALLEIRDSRLYRQQFPTFEAYCQERWGMVRRNADRLIQAAEVVENLRPIGLIPKTESQARPLTALEPEVQREVWREVVETTPPDHITAQVVEEKAKAAQPLNATLLELKAEINAPTLALFPVWLDKFCVKHKNRGMSKLRENRTQRRMTLIEVSRQIGINCSSLSRIERGQQTPSPKLALRLCRIYSLALEDIYPPSPEDRAT